MLWTIEYRSLFEIDAQSDHSYSNDTTCSVEENANRIHSMPIPPSTWQLSSTRALSCLSVHPTSKSESEARVLN